MDNKQILETLQVQPLSAEEKAKRHILGRLYGPIATCKEATRNGRTYNKDLWTKALSDELVKEKVEHKSLFLELGHPADREETDMEKVCACIPELPKIVGDDLYAYVDVLDTPNGRILQTLIDYGFIPGISSRGSGDIMANNEVDPDTFFLETWDIVQLPAVKKARLSVCESLDTNAAKLKKALVESIKAAKEEERALMQEALDNLDISLDTDESEEIVEEELTLANGTPANPEDIPWGDDEILTEETEDDSEDENIEENESTEEETEDDSEESEEDEKALTVKEFIKELKEYEDKTVELKPLTIDGKELEAIELELEDGEDDTVVIGIKYVDYDQETDDNIDDEEATADEVFDSESAENNETEDEAVDNGADEFIEALKDITRQKNELEEEVKSLKKDKTVSDAKVEELTEQLAKYKTSFARTSELAAKAKQLNNKVNELCEQLDQKETLLNKKESELSDLNSKLVKANKLSESVKANLVDRAEVEKLNEQLNTANQKTATIAEQCEKYKKKYNECLNAANNYKTKFQTVLNRYIESKASALGVSKSEITNRLNESYSLDDIDAVCDSLLECNYVSRLPFGATKPVQMTEGLRQGKATKTSQTWDGVDEALLELAGLK